MNQHRQQLTRPAHFPQDRRSIRMVTYDYGQPGAYFVTIVAQDRACLFDDPVLRSVAERYWQAIPSHASHVSLDAWILMPNHLHGILVIEDVPDTTRGRARHFRDNSSSKHEIPGEERPVAAEDTPRNASPLQSSSSQSSHAALRAPARGSLGAIVGNFKSVTARRINRIRHTPGAKIWQRNYYEHVIRNEKQLNRIRQYIADNPLRWELDIENPHNAPQRRARAADRYYATIWEEDSGAL